MITPELQLRLIVSMAQPRLEAITDDVASQPRAPGKWSRKEIVGHLIDSASNNHQRFVRAQFTDDLICAPYDQDAWVSTQRYGAAPWRDLIALCAHFNVQIARVMD
ncbi:MAG: DinB family protein, partial [Gemmatimonadaceae bacterium]